MRDSPEEPGAQVSGLRLPTTSCFGPCIIPDPVFVCMFVSGLHPPLVPHAPVAFVLPWTHLYYALTCAALWFCSCGVYAVTWGLVGLHIPRTQRGPAEIGALDQVGQPGLLKQTFFVGDSETH